MTFSPDFVAAADTSEAVSFSRAMTVLLLKPPAAHEEARAEFRGNAADFPSRVLDRRDCRLADSDDARLRSQLPDACGATWAGA